MFKRVILATDGSMPAQRAAAVASDIAATYGAELIIVSVLPQSFSLEDIERAPQADRLPPEAKKELRRFQDILDNSRSGADIDIAPYVPAMPVLRSALQDAILDDAEGAANKTAPKITRVADTGPAAQKILEHADKVGADLIVMGRRGLSDFSGILIGSVSQKVLFNAKCPCLTVK